MKLKATKSLSANLLHETITEEKIELTALRSKSSPKPANGNLTPDIKPPKYNDVDLKTVIENQILRKVDEGLGESFDLFSEVSEVSPRISGAKSASDITIHNTEDSSNIEHTGDKMESDIPNTFHSSAELPFSKQSSGPARKVTFLWGGQKETLPEDSVSQTYVYTGQPSPKKQL